MKKTLYLLIGLIALASLVLAACGGDDGDAEAAEEEPADSPEEQNDGSDDGAMDGPPAVILRQGDRELAGELGNAMWTSPDDQQGSYIADAFAVISLTETSKFEAAPAKLVVGENPFSGGTVTIFAVGEGFQPETVPGGEMYRWAAFPDQPNGPETISAEVAADGSIDLSGLAPGEYLVSFFGNWPEGYGEFGFYIEVI